MSNKEEPVKQSVTYELAEYPSAIWKGDHKAWAAGQTGWTVHRAVPLFHRAELMLGSRRPARGHILQTHPCSYMQPCDQFSKWGKN